MPPIAQVKCLHCKKIVRRQQEALQCDRCDNWQHRLCDTGISRELYRQAMRGEGLDTWYCSACTSVNSAEPMDISSTEMPAQESTRIDQAEPDLDTSSFNISRRSFQIPVVHMEQSLEDINPQESDTPSDIVTYHTAENGSNRNKPKLADSNGYTYTIKRQRPSGITDWWCSVRTKSVRCPATVIQTGTVYRQGTFPHNHDSNPGAITKLKIVSQTKQTASTNPFIPAAQIVSDAITVHAQYTDPAGSRPHILNLERSTNRLREKTRPKDPTDLNFEVNYDYIPDNFLRKDVTVGNNRHLIFATDQQLDTLSTAKVWYMDGTFKIIKAPFKQMFSIHAFLRTGDDTKQVPLVFCMMSSRTKKDYKKVLKKVVKLLPRPPVVKEFVADFEQGVWGAVKSLFPSAAMKGCAFHWGQAIWRHVQSLGLQADYKQHDGVYKFVRKLMALCYLPHEHILPAFNRLKDQLDDDAVKLKELTTYISDTWLQSTVWTIASWSVFMRPTRTNNDVEGWHHRLNRNKKAGSGNKGLYVLAPLLQEEAALLPLNSRLVSEGKLKKLQRKQFKTTQKVLFDTWNQYTNEEISISRLLRLCARQVFVPDS